MRGFGIPNPEEDWSMLDWRGEKALDVLVAPGVLGLRAGAWPGSAQPCPW